MRLPPKKVTAEAIVRTKKGKQMKSSEQEDEVVESAARLKSSTPNRVIC